MATNFRRTKLEKFVKRLEEELPDLENASKDENPHGMGMYYEGSRKTLQGVINKLKHEFNLKEDEKG